MFSAAGITKELRAKLWCETFKMAIDIYNITVCSPADRTREEKWSMELPKWTMNLRCFGEVAVIKKGGIIDKVEDKGNVAFFVGYPDNRAENVF